MNLLDFTFQLGVVFAIYGFLWGLIDIGLYILAGGRTRSLSEVYLFRAIKYFLLVDVTFLFCLNLNGNLLDLNKIIFTGIILLTYFIGKLQKNQNRSALFKMAGSFRGMNQTPSFSMRAESAIIALALILFATFWYNPGWAVNPISIWFKESIVNIEDTPVFGFIFKIIGFFFLLTLIFKMISAFTYIINGGNPPKNPFSQGNAPNEPKETDFDDYEEVE